MTNIGAIDIVGFPLGKLGIGEQTRSVARLAIASGFEVNLIDCHHPADQFLNDHTEFEHYVSKGFKNPIRIYSSTIQHIGALAFRFGLDFFDNRQNILHLAWEFDSRPKELDSALRLGDELWGISSFTSSSLKNELGLPVRTLHSAIDVPEFNKLPRTTFGLPDEDFLFCFSFDFNSFIERKNPLALIDAYKESFTEDSKVGLVLKSSNFQNLNDPSWKSVSQAVANRSDIYLLNDVMPREELLALFDCCNAYISLHRSEGAGLGLGECMLLGLPVICTGYSGNTDFCRSNNSFLVDYDLAEVKEGEYPNATGFRWANPKKKSAIEAMRTVFENRELAKEKALLGKSTILNEFSEHALANHFKHLVDDFAKRHRTI
ncbi:MAG: glycosyltransferase family 4 protein [Lentilitoribacter sp.]